MQRSKAPAGLTPRRCARAQQQSPPPAVRALAAHAGLLELHQVIVEALEEVGVDVSGRVPKRLSGEDVEWADLVVTMGCGDACPVLPGKQHVDWNLADPVGICLEEARELRAAIAERVAMLPL